MNELYVFTIYPIELIYKLIYLVLVSFTENYGLALFALSFLNYFLLIPLNKLVRGLQESESNIQQVLEPQLKRIKEMSSDAARHQRIQNLYQRYSYHPIFAIRNVFPLLVQLPFLMAVYFMLSSLKSLEGVSFLFLQNLAQPDAALFGLNLMPLVMTLVSIVNACFVVKLSKPQKNQAIIVSLLFLVLLYSAPSALLLYWTMNNLLILSLGLLSKITLVENSRLFLSEMRLRLLPSFINSSGLTIGLCFVIPLYFTMSLNVHFFNEDQTTYFAAFCAGAFILCLILGIILDKLIGICNQYNLCFNFPCKLAIKKTIYDENSTFKLKLSTFLYLFAAAIAAYFLSVLCLNLRLYFDSSLTILFIRLGLVLVLFFIIIKFNFKMLNYCLLSLLAFSSIQFAQTQHADDKSGIMANEMIKQAQDSFPWDEKLENRPNIYLVYLESYMNSKTLRETYQFDNSAFENKLLNRGFQIYDGIYSHASFTKGALLSLFLMSDNVFTAFLGNADTSTRGHNILSGSKGNLLFRFLGQNNYTISCFYDWSSYFIRNKNEFLDYTIEEVDNSVHSVLRDIAPSLAIKLSAAMNRPYHAQKFRVTDSFYKKTFNHISYIQQLNKPSFFLIKAPNDLHYDQKSAYLEVTYQEWIATGTYQKGVEKMNKELLNLIEEIEKHDPNGLIILVGDHGHKYACAAGGIPILQETPGGIKAEYARFNMSSEEFLEDMFSVYLAVKMPHSSRAKLELDPQFAYADLFKYIFAALDDNPKYTEIKSSNTSMNIKGEVLKRNSVIFQDGEKSK